jgi:RHS repeat-associated protein
MGGIPVANVDTSGTTSTIAYVTADQLGTPRAIATSSGTTEWQLPYQGNPWSEVAPTSNGYVYNLRSAGEYADSETGTNDNINRTRIPSLGRFGQSDPTGLLGGISTFAAVGNNPLRSTDRLGLQDDDVEDPLEEWEAWEGSLLGPNQVTSESPMQRDLDRGTCLAPGASDPGPVLRNEEDSLIPPSTLPQITQNYLQGMAFQAQGLNYLNTIQSDIETEVSVQPLLPDGTPAGYMVRLDAVGMDNDTGDVDITEFKSSATAPLTPNQSAGFPLIEQNGAVVVGNGGGDTYPAGTVLPPTTVQILRPGSF